MRFAIAMTYRPLTYDDLIGIATVESKTHMSFLLLLDRSYRTEIKEFDRDG
jgi:hypothetical protein